MFWHLLTLLWTLQDWTLLWTLRGSVCALKKASIREKSMQPRFFVFCSCLPKKLSGDVLAPSDPSLDPPGLCTCP